MKDMFFGDRFGVVKDRFGTRWGIAQHIEDVAPDELKRHSAEGMKDFQTK